MQDVHVELCLFKPTLNLTIPPDDQIFRNRTVLQANDCRDALAKALYARMFGWIVNGVNHHLQAEDVT